MDLLSILWPEYGLDNREIMGGLNEEEEGNLIHNIHEKIRYFILILTDEKSSYLAKTLSLYTIFTPT